MIAGNVNYPELCGLHPMLLRAIRSALEKNPEILDSGRYEVLGNDVYMNVMSFVTDDESSKLSELHDKYIDIQILLDGEEQINYGFYGSAQFVGEWNREDDYQLCQSIHNEQSMKLSPGMFVIFFPGEPHKPGICLHGKSKIKKVVIKVLEDIML